MEQPEPSSAARGEPDNDSLAPARAPSQHRSRERFERVLDAADAIIAEHPMDRITVAGIAERAGVTRSSVYLFFPTVYAIYNELGRRYLDELIERLRRDDLARQAPSWQSVTARLVDRTVAYYNARPVARMLVLGSGSTPELRVIDRSFDQRFAAAAREIFGDKWPLGRENEQDPVQVAVVLTTAVFAAGVFQDGEISDFYRLEAQRAAIAYLESCLRGRRHAGQLGGGADV